MAEKVSKGRKPVVVKYGIHSCTDESLVGRTVLAAKRKYKKPFGVPALSYTVLNGKVVVMSATRFLREGDVIEFVKLAGTKG